MESQLITTDYRFKVSATSICMTEVKEWTGESPKKNRTIQHENLKNNSTRGVLSKKSVKRLKQAVNWIVISSQDKIVYSMKSNVQFRFKVNFITLTIPPQNNTHINEKQFKQLLNTWLTYHRKYSNLNNYVWKLETHKDGRLHIHITTDRFLHWKSINSTWNNILRRNGLLEEHYRKHKNYSPNSTDVHSVKKIKKIGAYISKYMSKNNKENPMFNGRVWGCSSKISKVLNNTTYISPDIIGKVMKPIIASKAKLIEVSTEPNIFGRTYKVADIYFC